MYNVFLALPIFVIILFSIFTMGMYSFYALILIYVFRQMLTNI